MASRLGRWPSLAPAKNKLQETETQRKKQLLHLILQHIYTQVTQGHKSVKMRLKEEEKVKSTKQMEIY